MIVDDNPLVLRALRRVTRLQFNRVLTATHPLEAERCLAQTRPPFLLCDYWLSEEHAPATALILDWRERFSCLRRVALMSGTYHATLENCPGVDAFFQKPLEPSVVRDFFAQR